MWNESFFSAPQLKRHSLDSGIKSRFPRDIVSMLRTQAAKITGWLLVAVFVLGVAWYFIHPRAIDAMVIAECRQSYARARNRSDTLRIDGIVPERAGRGSAGVRCG